MFEELKYINHMNEIVEFGKNGIFVNSNDLHDYSWDITEQNNKISAFNMGIVEKTIPVVIKCDSQEEGIAIRNRLMEVAEKDVLSMEHGKIIIGDYYLKCFITGSSKSDYLLNGGYIRINLSVKTDYPRWVKETTTVFRKFSEQNNINDGKRNLDYNFDFPFEFTSEMNNKKLNNTGFVGTRFKLIIYGRCINPSIHISGHTYAVDAEISDSEYLTIDSMNKTIELTRYNGEKVNLFNNRNRSSYVFKEIPSGENIVTWDGDFGFDVILYDERSEPKWT